MRRTSRRPRPSQKNLSVASRSRTRIIVWRYFMSVLACLLTSVIPAKAGIHLDLASVASDTSQGEPEPAFAERPRSRALEPRHVVHQAREALQRIGHLQQLLALRRREGQRLGKAEADPA